MDKVSLMNKDVDKMMNKISQMTKQIRQKGVKQNRQRVESNKQEEPKRVKQDRQDTCKRCFAVQDTICIADEQGRRQNDEQDIADDQAD